MDFRGLDRNRSNAKISKEAAEENCVDAKNAMQANLNRAAAASLKRNADLKAGAHAKRAVAGDR